MTTTPLTHPSPTLSDLLDRTTILSLLATILLLLLAHLASLRLLPRSSTRKTRFLFIWHAWDALIHFTLEGSFLYNCFFTSVPYDPHWKAVLQKGDVGDKWGNGNPIGVNNFLDDPTRVYGSAYGTNPFARLWQVYAKADRRWGGADPTIISLELLTVFGGGFLALYICRLLTKRDPMVAFWMVVLGVGELYGGFITFAPEWLTGSVNLDTSNWMYHYLYLYFFNGLWVIIPIYTIGVGYHDMKDAFRVRERARGTGNVGKKGQ